VFEDSFDLGAAESVCSGGDLPEDKMLYALAGLVDKSVLATAEYDGIVRYHLLGTLREYVLDRLDDDERAALRGRHRDWYAEVVAQAEAEWFTSSQVARYTALRRDHPNLRAALTFCLETPGEERAGLSLAAALRFYWLMSGYITEGVAWLDRMLAAYRQPDLVRLKGLRVQGHITALVRDRAAATRVLDEARDLAPRLGVPHELAHVYQARGLAALFGGAPVEAAELLAEALHRHTELGDHANATYDRIQCGMAAGQLGHLDQAVGTVDAALTECRASGDHWTTSLALFGLGLLAIRQHDYARATGLHQESIRLRLPLGDRRNIGLNFEALAWCAVGAGDVDRAARLFGASLAIQEASGTRLRSVQPLLRLHTEHEAPARAALGAVAFDREREHGRRMPYPDAVAYALGEVRSPVRPDDAEAPAFGPLTKRERQIAELVAEGLTNKEIAARLVISTRTAEGHVENVLSKLNFSSRAQVAAWVTTQRAREGGDADF
jgi:non-specific serine/threonine protein kinase